MSLIIMPSNLVPIIREIVRYAAKYLLNISWIFLLGVSLAALIKTCKLDKKMYRVFSKNEVLTIFLATAAGLISPLCSCGILPVVLSLFEAGIPAAPIMALLITSPIMSPAALWLTGADLGWELALWKLGSALTLGVMTGFITLYLTRKKIIAGSDAGFSHTAATEKPCAVSTSLALRHKGQSGGIKLADNKIKFFWDRFKELFIFMGKFILLATIIEAVIVTLVPINLVSQLAGKPGMRSVLLMTILGIPLPTHQVAAVPILHGLLDMGLNKGAALAFLIAGPVTSIPALTALGAMTSKKLFWLYFAISLISAPLFGYLYLIF